MKTIVSKLLKPHSKNCGAVQAVKMGNWATPWNGIPEMTEWLSPSGERRGSRGVPWLVIRCNCRACHAIKIVKADAVAMIGD